MPRALVVVVVLLSAATLASPAADASSAGAVQADVEVEWSGQWYGAVVLDQRGDQRLIRYVGYGAEWDEWVGPDRLRSLAAPPPVIASGQWRPGDAIEVEWAGSWWPAEVVAVSGGQTLIHYIGYDHSWDEWVGAARVR